MQRYFYLTFAAFIVTVSSFIAIDVHGANQMSGGREKFCKEFSTIFPGFCDSDKDGLSDAVEQKIGTDPHRAMTNHGVPDSKGMYLLALPVRVQIAIACAIDDKSCFLNFAMATLNEKVCQKITDTEYRSECPRYVRQEKNERLLNTAVLTDNVKLCSRMKDEGKSSYYRTLCIRNVTLAHAAITKNPKGCFMKGILSDTKNVPAFLGLPVEQQDLINCVVGAGYVLGQRTACNKFTDKRLRGECEKEYDSLGKAAMQRAKMKK